MVTEAFCWARAILRCSGGPGINIDWSVMLCTDSQVAAQACGRAAQQGIQHGMGRPPSGTADLGRGGCLAGMVVAFVHPVLIHSGPNHPTSHFCQMAECCIIYAEHEN